MWWTVAYLVMGILTAEVGMEAILMAESRTARGATYVITVTAWWIMVVYALVIIGKRR